MSKAVGKTLKIFAIVTTVAFVAAFAAVGGLTFAVSALIATGVGKTALAIYAIGSALDPPQIATEDFKSDQAHNLRLTADPSPVKWHLLGETATAGTLIFRDAVGTDKKDFWMVIALAGHECTSLERFEWDGELVTFSSNNAVGKYADVMHLYFHEGTESQTADTNLVAASTKWTTAHRGRGVCYAIINIDLTSDLFQGGVKEMRFYLKGAAAYDPRLDSTRTEVGGSGSHRVDDQSTWAHTENPALLTARYAFGYRQNGLLIYGRGIDDSRISWEDVASSANSNEEQVALKAGGTEDRYTCNGVHFPSQQHGRNFSALTSSMAGMFYQTASKWRMQSGVPRTVEKTRSTDDFIAPVKSRGQRDFRDKFNGVKGLFPDATQRTESTDYPSLRIASAVAADGNQEHWLHLNLPFTDSNPMAQRISKIALQRTRMDRDAIIALNAVGLQDSVADTITITHTPLNLDAMKMRLIKWELRIVNVEGGIGLAVQESLEEEDDNLIYSWDETTEEQTPVGGNSQLRWDKQPYPATFVESTAGTFGESVFDRTDAALEPGGVLVQGISQNQGDDVTRIVPQGTAYASARDGDAVSFGTSWAAETIPEIAIVGGGITSSATLNDPVQLIAKSLSVTVSGFTMSARLKELSGTVTNHTDTGAVEDTTDVQWSMDKSQTLEADNDTYEFQFDVTVENTPDEPGFWVPGRVIIGIYIDDGGGFVQYATVIFNGSFNSATTVYTNQTKSVTVDGVGQIAGKEFRVVNESGTGDGAGTLDNFDSVKYSTVTAAADETATPTGSEDIRYQVLGGTQTV